MRRFVFRAQAALDLRQRQDEEARRELAAAEARAREARDLLESARVALEDALRRAGADEASGDAATRVWYRNWIVGQQQRIGRCRAIVEERAAAVRAATLRAQLARRKLRSLERFRDRALRRHTDAESRAEQKVVDELSTIRYALGRSGAGGGT
jgi:flagellar FliJ protein